jgi:nicotinamidase-related amidase
MSFLNRFKCPNSAPNRIICIGLLSTAIVGCSTDGNGARQNAERTPPTAMSQTSPSNQQDPLPRPGMKLQPGRFAIVLTDPQVDFFSPKGVAWSAVGESVIENKTVEHVRDLFIVAQETGTLVFISPHYYYPHDHTWKFEGAFEKVMHDIHFADRTGALSLEGFDGSGADWLDEYKPFIGGPNVVVCSPHKMYGPQSNDLVLQLRKQRIDQIVLAGMSANLCTESHLRQLVEEGFQVVVVADATAAAKLPGYDGYQAAMVNFRMIASDVWNTAQAEREIRAAR